jgi:hypothetical protein
MLKAVSAGAGLPDKLAPSRIQKTGVGKLYAQIFTSISWFSIKENEE